MGKKNKKDKKGQGAAKTERKTEKNMGKKQKKTIEGTGEDDIVELIAHFQEQDRKKLQVTEEVVEPPSPRSNFSFIANPDKDEIILFGGEYFNGKKSFVYSDLFMYSCKRNEWIKVDAPNSPPPRCGHQAVYMKVSSGNSQLWIFGGEFVSPTQSQFYHYKDLWCFNMKKKSWKMVCDKNGPSARSGHRMVAWKKYLILFGGFQDSGRVAKYFQDLWQFDTESCQWTSLKALGDKIPSPRSGFMFLPTADSRHIFLVGGYSKEQVKKEVEKGIVHTDIYQLKMMSKAKAATIPGEKSGSGVATEEQPRWIQLKPCGVRPNPRCGMSGIVVSGGGGASSSRALVFGGVHDEEEDEESVKGIFYKDLLALELDKAKWQGVDFRTSTEGKRRAYKAQEGSMDVDDNEESNVEEDTATKEMDVAEEATNNVQQVTSGVFTLTVETGTAVAPPSDLGDIAAESALTEACWPGPRMNCGLALVGHRFYLYGGMFEIGDRQVTLDDFYCLDLNRMDKWECLEKGSVDKQEWLGSDSESDSDMEDVDGPSKKRSRRALAGSDAIGEPSQKMSKDASSGSSDDDDDDELVENAPVPSSEETFSIYWGRTSEFWCQIIRDGLAEDDSDDEDSEEEGEEKGGDEKKSEKDSGVSEVIVKRYAMQTAKDFFREQKKGTQAPSK